MSAARSLAIIAIITSGVIAAVLAYMYVHLTQLLLNNNRYLTQGVHKFVNHFISKGNKCLSLSEGKVCCESPIKLGKIILLLKHRITISLNMEY